MKKIKNYTDLSIQEICYISLFTAVIAIMAQITIPTPSGVPITLQTFAIILAAVVLGAKLSTISTCIYLLLGAIGAPVLAGWTGGLGKFVGPTGGFLISFPLMALIIGLGVNFSHKFKGLFIISLILGITVNYIIGVAFFCFITKCSIMAGFTACVPSFITTDVIKAVLASIVGFELRKRLIAAGLL